MHSTGALLALAHAISDWYQVSCDESASSPSNAETITSTGFEGRTANNHRLHNDLHKHQC